jgi:hydroxymethylglutaryl-CoA lyase
LRQFEVGSFVNPARVPQMADAALLARHFAGRPGHCFLTLNQRGYDQARAAGVTEVAVVVGATDGFNRANIGMDLAAARKTGAAICAQARADGIAARAYVAVALGCPYEGAVDPGRVIAIGDDLTAAGAAELVLADTIGGGGPQPARALFARAAAAWGPRLAVHLHDTRGQAAVLAWIALEAGVRRFDAAIGGLGGCPFAPGARGNMATEDLAWLLDQAGFATGIDFDRLIAAGSIMRDLLGETAEARIAPWYRTSKGHAA